MCVRCRYLCRHRRCSVLRPLPPRCQMVLWPASPGRGMETPVLFLLRLFGVTVSLGGRHLGRIWDQAPAKHCERRTVYGEATHCAKWWLRLRDGTIQRVLGMERMPTSKWICTFLIGYEWFKKKLESRYHLWNESVYSGLVMNGSLRELSRWQLCCRQQGRGSTNDDKVGLKITFGFQCFILLRTCK